MLFIKIVSYKMSSVVCVVCESKRQESTLCDFGCLHYYCLDCADRRLARSDIVSFCLLVNKSKKPRHSKALRKEDGRAQFSLVSEYCK